MVGLLFAVAAAAAFYTASVDREAAARQQASVEQADPLTASIEAAQQRLEDVPGDYATWAQLGSAYVEQARVTADPSYYDKADGALQASLALRPEGNDAALAGQGALANARHDFLVAAELAGRALAINEFSATAWGVLTDARTQLGDYAGATEALQRMLELRPGLASFTRASYEAELHGDRTAPDRRWNRRWRPRTAERGRATAAPISGAWPSPRATSRRRPRSTPPASKPRPVTLHCCSAGRGCSPRAAR